jgi:uncharacterized protein YxjI
MEFPLLFRFKLIALAPQIYVSDASGRTISYIKQKLFRLKEKIEVFSDETRTHRLGTIQADRIIDWSARYHFENAAGAKVGSVGRKGMRSLWRAHYDVCTGSNEGLTFVITEETPIVKLLDGLVGNVPIVGMFSGFFLHPSYIAKRTDGTIVMRLKKETAFWEGRFRLDRLSDLNVDEENSLIFAFLMVNLLERQRG